jgi:RHS repeat-associated protein
MTCRAPTSALTCAGGSPTGASLTYDAERRLKYWQNGQNGQPITSQVWMLYDGAGNRVEQYTSGGSGSHTYYLPGNVEEVTPSGSLVKYYGAGGLTLGENTATSASGISYLASDGLDSVSEALNQTGTATGSVLYGPYGNVRYTSGTMPTAKGFTGQYADASTGLDYYGARYYDPTLGQFSTADTVADGLNRYGYVKGNPETYSDPSGHWEEDHPDPWGAEGESPSSLGEGDDGDGADGGSGPGTVGAGLSVGPAGDMSPDLVVIETPEGFEYVDPAITDAQLQAETQEIQDSQDLMRAEAQIPANDAPPEMPNIPNQPNTPQNPTPPQDLINNAENNRAPDGHAAGATANINGSLYTATSGAPTISPAGIGDGSTCAECHLGQVITGDYAQGSLDGQTINVGVAHVNGKFPCPTCQGMFGQLATYTGARINVWWGLRDVREGPFIGIGGPWEYLP